MTNKKILKNLLATASALAVITSGASAFAVTRVTTGNVDLKAATGFVGPWATGDDLEIHADAVSVDFNISGTKVLKININDKTGTTGTVSENVEIDEISTANAGNGHSIAITVAADKELKLNNGANYGAIGDLDLTAGGKVWIGQDVDISTGDVTLGKGTFTAVGAAGNVATAKDILDIDGGVVSLTYAAVNDITVTATKKADITVGEGSTANNIDLQAGTLLVGGAAGNGATANDILITTGTANINDYATVKSIEVTDKGTVNWSGANSAVTTAIKLANAGAVLNLSAGTVAEVVAVAGNGVVNVSGDAKITKLATAGQVKEVNLSNDATLTLGNGDAHSAKAITTDVDGKGTIKLEHNFTVETVGAAGKKLKAIDFGIIAGKTLKVTGKEFHADVIANGGGVAKGKVQFASDITVDGLLGGVNVNALEEVIVGDAAAAKVNFGDNLQNVVKLSFANIAGSEATISSVGNKAMVVDATANGGKLILTNPKDLELATVGANNALTEVQMTAAGNVKISGADFKAAKLSATKAAKDAKIEVNKLNNITAYSVEETGLTVAFRDDSALAGDLGAKDKSIKELRLLGTVAKTLDMNGKNAFSANVVADKADLLTVTNVGGGADATYGGFGTADARLASLSFAATGANTTTVNGEIYSNAVTTDANAAKIKLMKSVYGKDDKSTFTLSNAGTEVTVADGVKFTNMQLDAAAAGKGVLKFEGSTDVGVIGGANNLVSVTFDAKAGSVRNLSGDVNATNITMNEGTYNLASDLTFTGAVTTDKAVLNLAKGTTTVTGAITANGATTLNFLKDTKFTTTAALPGANVELNVVDVILSGEIMTDAVHAPGIGANAANVEIGSGNRFNSFTAKKGTTDHDLTIEASVNGTFKDSFKGLNTHASDLVNALTAVTDRNSTGYNMLNLIASNTVSDEKASEAINRIASTSNTTSVVASAASQAASLISQRIASAVSMVGMGAGDEDDSTNFGVWGQASGARATQKARKGDAGYKANAVGGTVGVDTMVSENTMLGVAATYLTSDVKFKDFKAGDKAKVNNMFFNVYAKHDLANNWFVQGATIFGKGDVKADSRRVTGPTSYDVAQAKYDTMAFGMEARVGYSMKIADNAAFVPVAGLSYVNVNEGGYTEKGSVFNRTVTKKAADKLTGILGAGVQGNMDMNGMAFMPEAHAYVNYDFKAKNPKVEAKIDGLANAINVSAAKQAKVSYNLGAGLNAKSGMVNYGVGYDAKLSNKFVSHQGSVRVRVDL